MKKLLLLVLLVCAAYAENTNTVPPPPEDILYQGSFSPEDATTERITDTLAILSGKSLYSERWETQFLRYVKGGWVKAETVRVNKATPVEWRKSGDMLVAYREGSPLAAVKPIPLHEEDAAAVLRHAVQAEVGWRLSNDCPYEDATVEVLNADTLMVRVVQKNNCYHGDTVHYSLLRLRNGVWQQEDVLSRPRAADVPLTYRLTQHSVQCLMNDNVLFAELPLNWNHDRMDAPQQVDLRATISPDGKQLRVELHNKPDAPVRILPGTFTVSALPTEGELWYGIADAYSKQTMVLQAHETRVLQLPLQHKQKGIDYNTPAEQLYVQFHAKDKGTRAEPAEEWTPLHIGAARLPDTCFSIATEYVYPVGRNAAIIVERHPGYTSGLDSSSTRLTLWVRGEYSWQICGRVTQQTVNGYTVQKKTHDVPVAVYGGYCRIRDGRVEYSEQKESEFRSTVSFAMPELWEKETVQADSPLTFFMHAPETPHCKAWQCGEYRFTMEWGKDAEGKTTLSLPAANGNRYIVRPGIALYFTLGRDENGDNVPDMSIHTWEQGTLIFYGSAKQGGSFTCPKADTP